MNLKTLQITLIRKGRTLFTLWEDLISEPKEPYTEPLCKLTGGHVYNIPSENGEKQIDVPCKLCGEIKTHATRKGYNLVIEELSPIYGMGNPVPSWRFRKALEKIDDRPQSKFVTCACGRTNIRNSRTVLPYQCRACKLKEVMLV